MHKWKTISTVIKILKFFKQKKKYKFQLIVDEILKIDEIDEGIVKEEKGLFEIFCRKK